MSRPAPACIAKLGITEVVDNLGPGQGVNFAAAFVRIFRTEIEQRILVPAKGREPCAKPQTNETPGSLPCHSDQ